MAFPIEALESIGRNPLVCDNHSEYSSMYVLGRSLEGLHSQDEISRMVGDVKKQVVYDDTSLQLTPLLMFPEQQLGTLMRFQIGWSDHGLRQGYLPELPSDLKGILNILRDWNKSAHTLVYMYSSDSNVEFTGFLNFEFTKLVGDFDSESPIKAWVSYGNLRPESLRSGITEKSLSLALRFLREETRSCGTPLLKVETSVSDLNIGSIIAFHNNGFILDMERPIEPSSIMMGGNSYPMVKHLESISV